MSNKRAGEWLLSQNSSMIGNNAKERDNALLSKKAQVISIASGKGGVGKTSVALKLAKILSTNGSRVLLIDCDYNLSNCMVKLGLPINNDFYLLLQGKISFNDSLVKTGHFDILSGCNGDLNLFENEMRLDVPLINILREQRQNYDYIILDSPAGLGRDALALNAYSDFRFIVITPDKSSITDSYSLVKIMNKKFGVSKFHLLMNKVRSLQQYQRIVRSFSETVESFLSCRLYQIGYLKHFSGNMDRFDRDLLKEEDSSLHHDFVKIIQKFTESSNMSFNLSHKLNDKNFPFGDQEHDVRM